MLSISKLVSIFKSKNLNFLFIINEKLFLELNLKSLISKLFKKSPINHLIFWKSWFSTLLITFPLTKNEWFFFFTSINSETYLISLKLVSILVNKYSSLITLNAKLKSLALYWLKKLSFAFFTNPIIL